MVVIIIIFTKKIFLIKCWLDYFFVGRFTQHNHLAADCFVFYCVHVAN